jgi:hypothetical protein
MWVVALYQMWLMAAPDAVTLRERGL